MGDWTVAHERTLSDRSYTILWTTVFDLYTRSTTSLRWPWVRTACLCRYWAVSVLLHWIFARFLSYLVVVADPDLMTHKWCAAGEILVIVEWRFHINHIDRKCSQAYLSHELTYGAFEVYYITHDYLILLSFTAAARTNSSYKWNNSIIDNIWARDWS